MRRRSGGFSSFVEDFVAALVLAVVTVALLYLLARLVFAFVALFV